MSSTSEAEFSPQTPDDFRAAIALGSNLGDSLSQLRHAAMVLYQLSTSPDSVKGSHIYRTEPVDCPPGSPVFLNAVVEIEWKKKPETLWHELQRLEFAAGRQRPHPIHAPRALDVDFLYLGSLSLSSGPLRLPHPQLTARRFVLAPLADCAPNRILPNQKYTIKELLARLPSAPSVEKLEEPLFT